LRLGAGSLGRKLLDRYLERHRLRPASTIDVPSVSLLLAYATGGVGIGLVPALPLGDAEVHGAVLELADVPPVSVQLVTRAGRPVVPAVERFIERLLGEAEKRRGELEARRGRKR
jgi:DNA-binding transcriptional LysR family regulator